MKFEIMGGASNGSAPSLIKMREFLAKQKDGVLFTTKSLAQQIKSSPKTIAQYTTDNSIDGFIIRQGGHVGNLWGNKKTIQAYLKENK